MGWDYGYQESQFTKTPFPEVGHVPTLRDWRAMNLEEDASPLKKTIDSPFRFRSVLLHTQASLIDQSFLA